MYLYHNTYNTTTSAEKRINGVNKRKQLQNKSRILIIHNLVQTLQK